MRRSIRNTAFCPIFVSFAVLAFAVSPSRSEPDDVFQPAPPLAHTVAATSPPLQAPPFDPASPEARLAKKLDSWRAAMASPRPIGAPSWILVDFSSGRVLAQHNADAKMYPASTTKIMMALTALNAVGDAGLDKVVTIGPNPPRTGEASINLVQGEQFSLRDLLRGALIKSANDACTAVAEGVAGNVPAFVHLMNAEARKVGATHSHFANPHGLHDPQHYTTARDLSLIARAALRYPFFAATVDTRDTTIHGSPKIPGDRKLVNRNRLLWRWADCDGVKTGYTREAGRCLVATATHNVSVGGHTVPFRLLSVVLHAPDSWSDSAQLLLHQGFEKYRPVEVAKAGETFGTLTLKNGICPVVTPRAAVLAVPNADAAAPVKRIEYSAAFAGGREAESAPEVKRGQVVGSLVLSDGGRPVARLPLVAGQPVVNSVVASAKSLLPHGRLSRLLLALCAAGALILLLTGLRRGTGAGLKPRPGGQGGQGSKNSYEATIRSQPINGQSEIQTESRDQFLGRIGVAAPGLRPVAPDKLTSERATPDISATQRSTPERPAPIGPAERAASIRAEARKPAAERDRMAERRAQTSQARREIEAIENARRSRVLDTDADSAAG